MIPPLCVVDLFLAFREVGVFLVLLFVSNSPSDTIWIADTHCPLSPLGWESWTAGQSERRRCFLVCIRRLRPASGSFDTRVFFSAQSNSAFNTSCSLCTSAYASHPWLSAVRGSVIIGSSGSVGVFSLQSFSVGNTFGLLQRALQVLQHIVFWFTACLYIDLLAHLASIWIGLVILLATASFPSHIIVLACTCLALNERRLSISNKSHVVTLLLRNDWLST
jgi:hypothetical protein